MEAVTLNLALFLYLTAFAASFAMWLSAQEKWEKICRCLFDFLVTNP